jgi:hypothetical protein
MLGDHGPLTTMFDRATQLERCQMPKTAALGASASHGA